jgi:hypothetical protein
MMQFSATCFSLLTHIRAISERKDPRIQSTIQAILQIIQLISKLPEVPSNHVPFSPGSPSKIIPPLADTIKLLQNGAFSKAQAMIQTLFDNILTEEQQMADILIPQLKLLFANISKTQQVPLSNELEQIGISTGELSFYLYYLFEFYRNGGPTFVYSNSLHNATKDSGVIRGKPITEIYTTLQRDLVRTGDGDADILWLPDIIISKGYGFRESQLIANFARSRGILVETDIFHNPDNQAWLENEAAKYSPALVLFLLDWTKVFSENADEQNVLCEICGVPKLICELNK